MALVFATFTTWAQSSKNISLLKNLKFGSDLSNLWGIKYNGTEYALVGTYDGLSIVSLASPANPVILQNIPGQQGIWREVKTYQDYVYVSNETGGGIQIIDLSNLPNTVTYKDTTIGGLTTSHTLWIDGENLYVFGADIDNGGASIFTLLPDPMKPVKIGAFTQRYFHDAFVRNDTCYAAEIYDGLFEMIDMTNKSNPVVMGSKSYVNSFTHVAWPNDKGTVAFTTDEVNAAYVYSWDVTNPSNIQELGSIRSDLSNGLAIPHNAHFRNDYLVVSYYADGVVIFDVSRPHNMVQVGWYDTNLLTGGGMDGCWGAYPYLPSGLLLASDMNEGLFVLNPAYVRGCYLEGNITDSATGTPISGAAVTINSTSATDNSNGNGFYATGVADAGSYTATYSKFGYISKTVNVTLANGVLVTKNVQLAMAPVVSFSIQVYETGTTNPVPFAGIVATTSGGGVDYTADANGQVSDPSFVMGTWTITAGAWAYQTVQTTAAVDSQNNSIVIQIPYGYYDDFIFDYSWTINTTANAGAWEKGDPNGTGLNGGYGNPEDDMPADFGVEAYVTGNGGGSAGFDDVDAGETILTSPVMDLTAYTNPAIKFHRWFANGGGFGGPIDDTLTIQITDDGLNWTTLSQVSGNTSNIWTQDSFPVSPTVTQSSAVQVRFVCGDYGSGHVVEGAVDVFEVTGAPVFVANEESIPGNLIGIFPNPVTSGSIVKYDVASAQLSPGNSLELLVTDLSGRVLFRQQLTGNSGSAVLKADLPAGVYSASIRTDDKVLGTVKIVR